MYLKSIQNAGFKSADKDARSSLKQGNSHSWSPNGSRKIKSKYYESLLGIGESSVRVCVERQDA